VVVAGPGDRARVRAGRGRLISHDQHPTTCGEGVEQCRQLRVAVVRSPPLNEAPRDSVPFGVQVVVRASSGMVDREDGPDGLDEDGLYEDGPAVAASVDDRRSGSIPRPQRVGHAPLRPRTTVINRSISPYPN
jgi:hypothetical protein